MSVAKNYLLTLSYFALLVLWGLAPFVPIPVSVMLVTMSTLIVFIGCHQSLNLLVHKIKEDGTKQEQEVLTRADALKFPLIGSAALGSLYLAFKYVDKETVNLIISVYFCLVGAFALTGSFADFMSQFFTAKERHGFKKTLPVVGEVDCTFTVVEFASFFPSCGVAVWYFYTKHFMLNNLFGICFCIQSIERISIGSYTTGAILLCGLFVYDIFWVFGTDVMVTVARSFDGPIKLLFVREFANAAAGTKDQFSLLGLGDIVIPALFIALLLRFDAVRSKVLLVEGIEKVRFPAPYFYTNLACYAGGLVVTVGVMYFFKTAQPALLYLVPACLGGSLAVGLARGEFSALFAYSEEEEKKEEKKGEEKEKKAVCAEQKKDN
jgi:minor histocompatibility antigen H13